MGIVRQHGVGTLAAHTVGFRLLLYSQFIAAGFPNVESVQGVRLLTFFPGLAFFRIVRTGAFHKDHRLCIPDAGIQCVGHISCDAAVVTIKALRFPRLEKRLIIVASQGGALVMG